MGDYISVFNMKNPTGKVFTFSKKNNKITKNSTVSDGVGAGEVVEVKTASELEAVIKAVSQNPNGAIVLGYPKGVKPGETFHILPLGRFKNVANSVEGYKDEYYEKPVKQNGATFYRRSKKVFKPSNWFAFDRDIVDEMPKELKPHASPDEWWSMMESFIPVIKGCERLSVSSATGRVHYLGQSLAPTNVHIYMKAKDGQDVQRFGAACLVHALLKGYGFSKPVSGGGARHWSIFDPTTFSHERFYFEGAPRINDVDVPTKGLLNMGMIELKDTVTKVYDADGGAVDTKKLTTPTKEEQKKSGITLVLGRKGTVRSIDHKSFTPETPLTVKTSYGECYTTMAEILTGLSELGNVDDIERFRCQSPFRHDSKSWAAYVSFRDGKGNVIKPHLFDVGTGIDYPLNDVIWAFDKAVEAGIVKFFNKGKANEKEKSKQSSTPSETVAEQTSGRTPEEVQTATPTTEPSTQGLVEPKTKAVSIRDSIDLPPLVKVSNQDNMACPEYKPNMFECAPDASVLDIAQRYMATYYYNDLLICRDEASDVLYKWNGVYWEEFTMGILKSEINASLMFVVVDGHKPRLINNVAQLIKMIAVYNNKSILDVPHHHITCKNGIVDIKNKQMLPFNHRYFYRTEGTFNYNPDAQGSLEGLIDDYACGERNWKRKLLQMCGYILAGGRNTEEKIMLLDGVSRSGKSLIANMLTHIIGNSRINSMSIGDITNDKHMIHNHTAHALYDDDCVAPTGSDYKHWIGTFKKLCSGAVISTTQLYTSARKESFVNIKMLACSNGIPHMPDPSGATQNRIEVITFSKSYAGKEDTSLKTRLYTDGELAASFNLFLYGYYDWLECGGRGFPRVESSEELMVEERRGNQPILDFFDDVLNFVDGSEVSVNGYNAITTVDLLDRFNAWVIDQPETYLKRMPKGRLVRLFKQNMQTEGAIYEKKVKTQDGRYSRGYRGVIFK